ncbi:hypothetical protein HHK36_016116 [Tetracentron sinense]|uniref:UDP-glycosyltransferases domain-containing protein n=1 Tax=Tetracentron sinense TaxID=13715 RepID=A0A834Z2Y0_TETSI|nr:hypothetical protein HHK36_016116 [Tetracentron sinense]
MDSRNADRISGGIPGCHLVAMPYPGRGHINPMMNVCKLLASRVPADILITFVVTEEWLGFIRSDPTPTPPNIRLRSIPNVIPSELVRGVDISGFFEAAMTKMEDPFERLLDRLEAPVTAIVSDTVMVWALAVGNRRNIPVVSLWTMSPSVFSVLYHFDLLVQNRHFPVDLLDKGDERVDYIPGISSTCLKDLPIKPVNDGSGQLKNRILEALSCVRKAQCLLLTSFYEIDTYVTDTLRAILPFPVYPLGPAIPYSSLAEAPSIVTGHNVLDYFKWLDSQPRRSVMYISLGSFLSVSSSQMDEIAAGLRGSGIPYLWSRRGEISLLQEACGEMGLVVPWCDQLRVLSHSSIGGFLTHCGWNSTLEEILVQQQLEQQQFELVQQYQLLLSHPVVLLALALQLKAIVDDWKVGWRVMGAENLVKREEIGSIVQRFMDLERDESKEMRSKARELQETCQRAIGKGKFEVNLGFLWENKIQRCRVVDLCVFISTILTAPLEVSSRARPISTQGRALPSELPYLRLYSVFPPPPPPRRFHPIPAMDSTRADRISGRIHGCHVVAMPYPGRGHINPMMNVCKLLASRLPHILITFVVTEEWLGFIRSDPTPPNIRLRSIPNVIPSELVRGADFPGFLEATMTKMEDPFERLLDRLEAPVTAIVADTYLLWVPAVGNRRNIPVASLWPMSPSVFSVFYHFDLLVQNQHFPVDLLDKGDGRVDYIPGISSTCLTDLPSVLLYGGQLLNRVLEAFSCIRKVQCLLLTSFYELDTHVIDSLRAILPFTVYPLGPAIPYSSLGEAPSIVTGHNVLDYFKWLDSQPRRSVLYVSLGSFLSVSSSQMDEIAAGLRSSGVPYLWVGRGETSRLQEACGEMGLVVPWCDQLRVLSHPSIGGFLTHCGWNSTLEGVFAGVPMLTFPIFMDQAPNSKLIVDDWKVGWRVKTVVGAETLVKREEIARIVKRFMDLEGDASKEMRSRTRELQETCQRAIGKGGSLETNLDAFIKDIL